jgi:hypothetical protein
MFSQFGPQLMNDAAIAISHTVALVIAFYLGVRLDV